MAPILVDDTATARSTCEDLKGEKVLGMDCEGVDLGPKGNLTLVQLCKQDGSIYLFDVCACPEIVEILREILESGSILKIIHDCRGERANLKNQFGIGLRNVFDTQIAFHYSKPSYKRRIGLAKLCQQANLPKNPFKSIFDSDFYDANPKFWAKRPMSQDMIGYAAADVMNLFALYNKYKVYENNGGFKARCAREILSDDARDTPENEALLCFY